MSWNMHGKINDNQKKKSEFLVPQQRNCLNTSLKCLVTGFWNSICGN